MMGYAKTLPIFVPLLPVVLAGCLGLVALSWRALVSYKLPVLGFLEFLAQNAAFTALLVTVTGQNLDIKFMPLLQKVQFAVTFALLYCIAYNVAKIREKAKIASQNANER